MADLIVSGGTVITMDGGRRVIPDGAVAVSGGAIAAVGPRAEVEAAHAAPKRIDARGKAHHIGFVVVPPDAVGDFGTIEGNTNAGGSVNGGCARIAEFAGPPPRPSRANL